MIKLKEIEAPKPEEGLIPVMLSDETMQNRKARLLENMQKDGFDAVILNICAVFYRALRKHCLFFMQMVRHLWYWEMKI